LKPKKIHNVNKTTTNKQIGSSIWKVGTTIIAIDNHIVVIQVQIEMNIIEDVLLDGGSRIHIIT
jgi:hypothetical protein